MIIYFEREITSLRLDQTGNVMLFVCLKADGLSILTLSENQNLSDVEMICYSSELSFYIF